MAISPRLIKRRIRSINNTRKITRAMELVAAAKMRKAVQLTLASREYSGSAEKIVGDIRKLIDPSTHPLLAGRPDAKTSLVIVVGSNRGLCGGFNAQAMKKAFEFLGSRPESQLHIVTVGRRADQAMKRNNRNIVASFDSMADAPHFDKTRPVGSFAYKEFMDGNVDRVFLVYTDFKSALSQIPTVKQLLPIIPEKELGRQEKSEVLSPQSSVGDEMEGDKEADETADFGLRTEDYKDFDPTPILFEPDPRSILDALLPRLLETEIYQGLLESAASEHSARMLAMRNATDNASDMLDDLTFTFNQARQANITREISEISAGKAAIQ